MATAWLQLTTTDKVVAGTGLDVPTSGTLTATKVGQRMCHGAMRHAAMRLLAIYAYLHA